jgi:hypothetical protein
MITQELYYALAKQVPDMARRGFHIGTCYGDIAIDSGPMAQRIAAVVQRELERELAGLQASAPDAAAPITFADGSTWLDHYVLGTLPTGNVIGDGYLDAALAKSISGELMAQHERRSEQRQALSGHLSNLRQAEQTPACAGLAPTQAAAHAPAVAGEAPAPHTHCAAPRAPCQALELQPPAPQSQPKQMGEQT